VLRLNLRIYLDLFLVKGNNLFIGEYSIMNIKEFSGQIGGLTPLMDDKNHPKYSKALWYRVPLFDYRWQQNLPDLVYTDVNGVKYQLDRHFETDGGSIPPVVRWLPFVHLDPWNFPRSYLFHDCTYQYGGIYIKYPDDDIFKFRLRTRDQTDKILGDMLPLDGATNSDHHTIMSGIWLGSRFVWDDKKPLAQKQARKDGGVVVYDEDGNITDESVIIEKGW
jgi:hypothetical protein